MPNTNLIASLMKIEMYNLKNVCPIMYKSCRNTGSTNFIPFNNVHETETRICFSNIYFINGYNQYIPLLSHIQAKYNVKNIVGCSAKCNAVKCNKVENL
jgi:hypothetical protein